MHEFLEDASPSAAAKVVRSLVKGVRVLDERPKMSRQLKEFEPREVRRIVLGRYEVRYEVTQVGVVILRLWHTREDR